jgi:hypothetical protein
MIGKNNKDRQNHISHFYIKMGILTSILDFISKTIIMARTRQKNVREQMAKSAHSDVTRNEEERESRVLER